MHNIQYRLNVLWLTISYLFRKTYTANVCGHQTKKTGQVKYRDESHVVAMPFSGNGNPDYCLDCVSKMSISCAWCEKFIHVDDPVTLVSPEKSFTVPEYAVRYDKDESCIVGCLRWNCADSGVDRQGFWMPPGKVARVPSPIEILMSGGNEDKAVIVGDYSDLADLGKII